MAKNKSRIPSPQTVRSEGKSIIRVEIPKNQDRPSVSITYLEITSGEYSLKSFGKKCQRESRLYAELAEFTERAKSYANIQELLDNHCPRNGLKSKDEFSRRKMNEIKRKYNVDTSEMYHIHLKPNGKGAFVIHGFTLKNCFEVVWLDPEHKIHKC